MANRQADEDDAYVSAEDEDFNPEVDDALSESSDEGDDAPRSQEQSSNKRRVNEAEDLDFDNSGDEATIQKAKRKKRKNGSARGQDEDDDGGDGGLVKTRAQRQAEKLQERDAPQLKSSSLDVNAIWAKMSGGNGQSKKIEEKQQEVTDAVADRTTLSGLTPHRPNADGQTVEASTTPEIEQSHNIDTVTITRTYDFAGETITEKRNVPKDSAEARLYLAQQQEAAATAAVKVKATQDQAIRPGVRRPMRKALIPGAGDANFTANNKAVKLNTVQKSKLDWAKLVDEEGLGDELDEHRKAKDTYLGRMDFLDRMSARDEENRRSGK